MTVPFFKPTDLTDEGIYGDAGSPSVPALPALPALPPLPSRMAVPPPMPAPFVPATPGLQAFLPQPNLAQKIAPVAIMALAAALGKRANGLAQGYTQGQQTVDAMNLHRAQLLQQDALRQEQQRRLDLEEQRRQEQAQLLRRQGLGKLVFDSRTQGRSYTTREQFDDYIRAADEQASQIYGAPAGYVSGQVQFIAPAIQGRARAQVDALRKGWKSLGMTPDQMQQSEQQGSVSFDIDGDGKAEKVRIARLLDWSGEGVTDEQGKLLTPAAPRVQTFGDVFAATRGTPFENKPLPTKAGAQGARQPDYGEASLTLERMGLLTSATERNRAKEDAKTSLRDDLEAALSGAATGDLTNIAKQMRRVGLNFDAEAGRIRSKLIQQGLSLLPPTERDKVYGQPESYNPEALITRATNARRGRPTAVAERGDVRLTRDATAPPASDTPIRAEARRQLEAARKASGDVRPVTDADVNQILAKPGNLAKLKQAVSAR